MAPAGGAVAPDWLTGPTDEEHAVAGPALKRVQFHWPAGMPLCRPLGDSLWEMRSDGPDNRVAQLCSASQLGLSGRLVLQFLRICPGAHPAYILFRLAESAVTKYRTGAVR